LNLALEGIEQRAARSSAAALVSERRIGKAIADDPPAGRQRGTNHLLEVTCARSEHQQRFDLGR
jgi:hypothetical protein